MGLYNLKKIKNNQFFTENYNVDFILSKLIKHIN